MRFSIREGSPYPNRCISLVSLTLSDRHGWRDAALKAESGFVPHVDQMAHLRSGEVHQRGIRQRCFSVAGCTPVMLLHRVLVAEGRRHCHSRAGETPSRSRPPIQAAAQATAAPSSRAAPVRKPTSTALRRALWIALVALATKSSTRRSASGWASPVRVETSRTRCARSSGASPRRPEAARAIRPASARLWVSSASGGTRSARSKRSRS